MIGLALETATEHVEVLVRGAAGEVLAHEIEDVAHGHTRRVTPLVARALGTARVKPLALRWVAVDLGPGSFTGVRVGIATAGALALAAGARVLGASSLAALAHGVRGGRAIVVPLIPAGRRDLYAGFYRGDARGAARLIAAPIVGRPEVVLAQLAEVRSVAGALPVRCVGPGVARVRGELEAAYPGSAEAWRAEGLSAVDLAQAALAELGPAHGLPSSTAGTSPQYIRPAQAEALVRHRATAGDPVTFRDMAASDVPQIAAIELDVFSDPWPESFFHGELAQPLVYARVALMDGAVAGYSVAWLGAGSGHLGNLAVVPQHRRRGLASRLVVDLLERARATGADHLTLEVRVSNFAAQALYRAHGFRLAGLRRGYYRDTGEDALIMEWRAGAHARRVAEAATHRGA